MNYNNNSPASDSLNESLGSLRYANSAKNIQNKPKVNKDKNSSLIIAVSVQREYNLCNS